MKLALPDIYFSRFALNTYSHTPYFQAHCGAEYRLNAVLPRAAGFRFLPPNLRALSELSQAWARRHGAEPTNIDLYYDAAGFELDPDTGARLATTNSRRSPLPDIPLPAGGFADPLTWEPPAATSTTEDVVDRAGLTREQIRGDIAGRGRERTAAAYGVPDAWLGTRVHSDEDLVMVIMEMDGKPWPEL